MWGLWVSFGTFNKQLPVGGQKLKLVADLLAARNFQTM